MALGVFCPIAILTVFEVFYTLRGKLDTQLEPYLAMRRLRDAERSEMIGQSRASRPERTVNIVLGISIMLVGFILTGLGVPAGTAMLPVMSIGALVTLAGVFLLIAAWRRAQREENE